MLFNETVLTVFALALFDERLVLDVIVARFAVEPSTKRQQKYSPFNQWAIKSNLLIYRFTSSALCAIKNPCVFARIFTPRGLIEILLSLPSSPPFISIASKSSLSFVKQSLCCWWESKEEKSREKMFLRLANIPFQIFESWWQVMTNMKLWKVFPQTN